MALVGAEWLQPLCREYGRSSLWKLYGWGEGWGLTEQKPREIIGCCGHLGESSKDCDQITCARKVILLRTNMLYCLLSVRQHLKHFSYINSLNLKLQSMFQNPSPNLVEWKQTNTLSQSSSVGRGVKEKGHRTEKKVRLLGSATSGCRPVSSLV